MFLGLPDTHPDPLVRGTATPFSGQLGEWPDRIKDFSPDLKKITRNLT
jgi:hypothetical protein